MSLHWIISVEFSPYSCQEESMSKAEHRKYILKIYSNKVVEKISKNFFIYYDKVKAVYDPDDIDFNRTC